MSTTVELRRGRVYLRPQVKRLAHDTTTHLLPRPGDVLGRHVVLDLGNIEFVEPFGLVYLYLYARRLVHYGAEHLEVRIPRGDVNTYLTRMDVCERLAEDPRIRVRPPLILRRRELRERLIELKIYPIHSEDEADELADRMLELIHHRRGGLGDLAEPLHLTLTELLSNIAVH